MYVYVEPGQGIKFQDECVDVWVNYVKGSLRLMRRRVRRMGGGRGGEASGERGRGKDGMRGGGRDGRGGCR